MPACTSVVPNAIWSQRERRLPIPQVKLDEREVVVPQVEVLQECTVCPSRIVLTLRTIIDIAIAAGCQEELQQPRQGESDARYRRTWRRTNNAWH
eukprot:4716764-Prymnesium_polylepis.1